MKKFLAINCISAFLLALCALARAGDNPAQVTIDGPGTEKMRIEALGPHVARVWVSRSGNFARATSAALETAPAERGPLSVLRDKKTVAVDIGSMTVRVNIRDLSFGVEAEDGAPVLAGAEISLPKGEDAPWRLSYKIAPEEKLFGLGQDNHNNGRLNRRGVIRDLWEGQQINSGNVTAQYPVPLLLSSGAKGHSYGLFIDNVHRMVFDLAKSKADTVRCDAAGGEADFYIIDGPKLSDLVERYTALTGRAPLPPLWALGYWQSKCTYWDWNALDEAYKQLTERGFPVDVMVIDADWPEVITDYRWARRWIDSSGSTPADKIADYAKKGVKIVMSQSGPMVKQESPTFADGWAKGVFATDGKGHPVECGYYGGKLLDFTSPSMKDWLWPQTRRLDEQGIAGWWLDLIEPEGEPPQTHYYGGLPAQIHNLYSLLCEKNFEGVQLDVHPEQRPFILARAASAGSQRYHTAVWTGDIYSDYATLRAHPPEMLNTGLSGLPWWTNDTGGFLVGDYKNDRFGAHARLYERWMQFSAFCPITRAHKAGGPPEPYALGLTTEQGARKYLQLRYRLLPYIYSYAWESSRDGMPLARALPLQFQDDEKALSAPGDEYMFGGELLVAPVLFEGQTSRKVYFPKGKWLDWDYGYEYEGGRDWVVSAPQNRIPVAIRAGAIIPLAPDMRNTSEKPWDPLTLEIYPYGKSGFTLYHDDGRSFDYQKGAYTTTLFSSALGAQDEVFSLEESNKLFAPKEYRLRFHLDRTPLAVSVDSVVLEASEWRWDADARVLSLALPDGGALGHTVRVGLYGGTLPARIAPELKEEPVNPKLEAQGSMGKPAPHIFPPQVLPAVIKAVNYDNGGEGVAFHSARALPERKTYREDSFNIADAGDAGFVLADLRRDEWLHYTIDCADGGYFDLTVRAAGGNGGGKLRLVAQDQTIASVDIPATGGAFTAVTLPSVYLNPGELTLLAYVDVPGFSLDTVEFATAKNPPSLYPAALAARSGVTDVGGRGEDPKGLGYVQNLGREGTGLAFGILGGDGGPETLRLRYNNWQAKPLALSLSVGDGRAQKLSMPPTGGDWKTLDVRVQLKPDANRVCIKGLEPGWDMLKMDSVEVLK